MQYEFIIYSFVFSNIDINYVNFKFFYVKIYKLKKILWVRVRVRLRIRFGLRVRRRRRIRFRVRFRVRVRVRFRVRLRVLSIRVWVRVSGRIPNFGPYFKFFLTISAFRALILSYYFISDHILSFWTRKPKQNIGSYNADSPSKRQLVECSFKLFDIYLRARLVFKEYK